MAGRKRKPRAKRRHGGNRQRSTPGSPTPELALKAHKSGDLDAADALYQSFLEDNPEHGRALYLRGLLCSQKGALADAADLMSRGLSLDPVSSTGHNNLGTVYQRLGRIDEAEAAFQTALEQDPGLVPAAINLGSIYQQANRLDDAERCFRHALEHDPGSAEACVNLGALLRQKGQLEEAEEVLRRAVSQAPELASAHNNLGIVLHEHKRLKEAFMAFKRALEIDPSYGDAYNNMGSVFRDQKQMDAALACYDKALALAPDWADAHNNKGAVLQGLGHLQEAEIHFRRANELRPDFPPALMNLGTVLHKSGRHDEALSYYERAIAADPEYPEAHFGLAELLLYLGEDLQRGWAEHFWRWRKAELRDQWTPPSCPLWQGEPLAGKRIRIWGEQGVGEEIMYATLLPDLISLGAEIQFECEERLVALFERALPQIQCRGRGHVAPFAAAPDYHCAAADLGRWLRPDLDAFPARPVLLRADDAAVDRLRKKYRGDSEQLLVGISWFSANPEMGWEKSIDLMQWAPLLRQARQTQFVDLQYGDTHDQRRQLREGLGIDLVHDESIDQLRDLDGFAAQVAAMDLVISISNTTVHMAGALGVPTWCLLSSAPLWRWFKARDCLWYPSVRFFRQASQGDWQDVITRVAAEFGNFRLNIDAADNKTATPPQKQPHSN